MSRTSAKISFNLLMRRFRDWADASEYVTDYGSGELPDLAEDKKTDWTMLYVVPTGATLTLAGVDYNFDFIVLGHTETNPDSKQDYQEKVVKVQSDCLQILQDLVAEIHYKTGTDFVFDSNLGYIDWVEGSNSIPFEGDYAQLLTGWSMSATISVAEPLDTEAC